MKEDEKARLSRCQRVELTMSLNLANGINNVFVICTRIKSQMLSFTKVSHFNNKKDNFIIITLSNI